jgi:hypothetical protein
MIGEARAIVVVPAHPLAPDLPLIIKLISLFHRIWPVAGLAAAATVNMAWVGFLGYGLFRLVELALF